MLRPMKIDMRRRLGRLEKEAEMTTFAPTPELFDAAFAMIAIAETHTSWRMCEHRDATWAQSLAEALAGCLAGASIDDLWAKVPADANGKSLLSTPGELPPMAREALEAIAAGEA